MGWGRNLGGGGAEFAPTLIISFSLSLHFEIVSSSSFSFFFDFAAAQQHGGSVTGATVPSIVQDVAKGKGLLGLYPRILDQICAHKQRGHTS